MCGTGTSPSSSYPLVTWALNPLVSRVAQGHSSSALLTFQQVPVFTGRWMGEKEGSNFLSEMEGAEVGPSG